MNLDNFIDQYDLFGKSVPQFRLQGKEKIGSIVGCFLSLLMTTLVLAYSSVRGFMLVTGDRPIISSYTVQNERKDTMVDLNKFNF